MVSLKSGFDLFSLQSNIELLFRGFKIHLETVQVGIFMVEIVNFFNNIFINDILHISEVTFLRLHGDKLPEFRSSKLDSEFS